MGFGNDNPRMFPPLLKPIGKAIASDFVRDRGVFPIVSAVGSVFLFPMRAPLSLALRTQTGQRFVRVAASNALDRASDAAQGFKIEMESANPVLKTLGPLYDAAFNKAPLLATVGLFPALVGLLQSQDQITRLFGLSLQRLPPKALVSELNRTSDLLQFIEMAVLPYLHTLENLHRVANGKNLCENAPTVGGAVKRIPSLTTDEPLFAQITRLRNLIAHGGVQFNEQTGELRANGHHRAGMPIPADDALRPIAEVFVPLIPGAFVFALHRFVNFLFNDQVAWKQTSLTLRCYSERTEEPGLGIDVEYEIQTLLQRIGENHNEGAEALKYLRRYSKSEKT